MIKDQNYLPGCWAKSAMLASLVAFILSVGIGIWCVINRLIDFRQTRKIARDREDWESDHIGKIEIDRRLEARRAETKKLGKRTWLLFWWQIGTFAFGVAGLITTVVIAFHAKLF